MSFYTWIDTPTPGTNVMATAAFSSDSQRAGGFSSGTVASSIRVNTALRQSTLVTAALMNAMVLGSMDYLDSVADVQSAMESFFNDLNITVNPTLAGTETVITGLTIHGTKYKVNSGGSITVDAVLSNSSTNPVQNKVITGALANKVEETTGTGNIYDTFNATNIGTYTYVRQDSLLYLRVDSYTGGSSNTSIQYKLVDFPNDIFSGIGTRYGSFSYSESGNAKPGSISVSNAMVDVTINVFTADGGAGYAKNLEKAVGKTVVIML